MKWQYFTFSGIQAASGLCAKRTGYARMSALWLHVGSFTGLGEVFSDGVKVEEGGASGSELCHGGENKQMALRALFEIVDSRPFSFAEGTIG